MRLKRTINDFRVSELVSEDSLLGQPGNISVYRVVKKGLTTFEAIDVLAKHAGVDKHAVQYAGLKDKDGITSQLMTVEGGRVVNFREPQLAIRKIGQSSRHIESKDSEGNSFEIVVRDLRADDMRRMRVNMLELNKIHVPNYFDDQRFGCLRHGQGFIVRQLMSGNFEKALLAMLAAPSKYGSEKIEQFKYGIQKRWGDWAELASYTKHRRGYSAFEHLLKNPTDFSGAIRIGIASREKTIHLFAYQSYLWNKAASHLVQSLVDSEQLAWLPNDASSLPVYRSLTAKQSLALSNVDLPLLGPGVALQPEAEQAYSDVFKEEGFQINQFLDLDLPGFRPLAEPRPFLAKPEFLRGAPAETDNIYKKNHKMRIRFTLPRGHYATLICKRILMPTEPNYGPLRIWISRHSLDWPDDDGQIFAGNQTERSNKRKHSQDSNNKKEVEKNIKPGDRFRGRVTRVEDFGCFVKLNRYHEGLCHISELDASRVETVKAVCEEGDFIDVVVLSVDGGDGKIRLSRRVAMIDSEEDVQRAIAKAAGPKARPQIDIKPGDRFKARVTGIKDFGCFVELKDSYEGLCPISELNIGSQGGDFLDVVVLSVDERGRKIRVSNRVAMMDSEEDVQRAIAEAAGPKDRPKTNVKPGDRFKGRVTRVEDFGCFVKLNDSDEGLCHISELDEGRIEAVETVCKEGDSIDVVVLNVNARDGKIRLSRRIAMMDSEEDVQRAIEKVSGPRERARTNVKPGDRFRGRVTNVKDFGCFVKLNDSDEGLCHISELDEGRVESVADVCKEGDSIDVVVLNVNGRDGKIRLSRRIAMMDSEEDVQRAIAKAADSKRQSKFRKDASRGKGFRKGGERGADNRSRKNARKGGGSPWKRSRRG